MNVKVYRSMVARYNLIETLAISPFELPRVGEEVELKTGNISNYSGRVSKVIRHYELGEFVGADVVVIVKRLPRPSPNVAERRSTNVVKRRVKR